MGHELIHMWDKTHSYVGHDPFVANDDAFVKWCTLNLDIRDMTYLYVGQNSCIYGTCLLHMWDMTET